jgi:hypothetical protein
MICVACHGLPLAILGGERFLQLAPVVPLAAFDLGVLFDAARAWNGRLRPSRLIQKSQIV